MQLFVQVDASDEQVKDRFAVPQGSIIEFRHGINLPGSHGMPPEVHVNVVHGTGIVEPIGSFQEGFILPEYANPASFQARPKTPASSSALVPTKSTGSAVVEVVASSGDHSESTTFTLTVTPAIPEPDDTAGLLI